MSKHVSQTQKTTLDRIENFHVRGLYLNSNGAFFASGKETFWGYVSSWHRTVFS